MREIFILIMASVFAPIFAEAQAPSAFPPGAEARDAQLMVKVGPQTRAWIRQEAAREAKLPEVSETVAVNAVRKYAVLGDISNADIEAVAFLVMMQAAKSAQEDLKAIAAGVKQVNDAKAAAARSANVKAAAPARSLRSPPPATNSAAAVRSAPANRVVANRAAISPRPLPKAEFDRKLDGIRNDPDSLSEMGEMESLRLQMAMERRSKAMQTLSNILKKMSDTNASITQNLK